MLRRMRARIRQGIGKVRRFAQIKLLKRYVSNQHRLRQGDCVRCGTCCRLLFKCPFFTTAPDGLPGCRIYEKRPHNCRIFPVTESDLRDRDSKMPHLRCGYHFGRPYRPFK